VRDALGEREQRKRLAGEQHLLERSVDVVGPEQ
jgi:hypothetical protein